MERLGRLCRKLVLGWAGNLSFMTLFQMSLQLFRKTAGVRRFGGFTGRQSVFVHLMQQADLARCNAQYQPGIADLGQHDPFSGRHWQRK